MQLKSLKLFCDIVRLGSFSKAAELNGVSQPSASQLVHQLEERLGVRLIDRSHRPIELTPEGRRYHEGCRDLVHRYEELERAVRDLGASPAGRLRVAAIYSVGLGQLHRVLERFRADRPAVDLRVDYVHPDQVTDSVLRGEADLGLTSYPEPSRRLSVHPWREEPFALAVPPTDPLAGDAAVSPDTLCGREFVMPRSGLRVRDEIDRWLATHRVGARVVAEFDNLESVKRAVEVAEGIALLPTPTFSAEVEDGRLVRVPLEVSTSSSDRFVRPLGVVRRRGEELSEPASRFLELLSEHADDPSEAANRPRARRPAATA